MIGHPGGEPIVTKWSISVGLCSSILLVDRVGEGRDEIKNMLKVSRADRETAGRQDCRTSSLSLWIERYCIQSDTWPRSGKRGSTRILYFKRKNNLLYSYSCGQPYNHEISQSSTGRSRLLNLVNAFEDATQTTHTTSVILFKRSALHAVEI